MFFFSNLKINVFNIYAVNLYKTFDDVERYNRSPADHTRHTAGHQTSEHSTAVCELTVCSAHRNKVITSFRISGVAAWKLTLHVETEDTL